jgi:hypothetical protein
MTRSRAGQDIHHQGFEVRALQFVSIDGQYPVTVSNDRPLLSGYREKIELPFHAHLTATHSHGSGETITAPLLAANVKFSMYLCT